jgi:hypothetical protein
MLTVMEYLQISLNSAFIGKGLNAAGEFTNFGVFLTLCEISGVPSGGLGCS